MLGVASANSFAISGCLANIYLACALDLNGIIIPYKKAHDLGIEPKTLCTDAGSST